MKTTSNIKRLASLAFVVAVGATGCAASTFSAQVVSCVDQTPVPEAKLTYKAVDGTPRASSAEGEMPPLTGDSGRVRAEVTAATGTTYLMSIEKEGYEPKTARITSGRDQTICLNPTPAHLQM